MTRELWTNRRAAIVRSRPALRAWLIDLRGWANEPVFYERAASVYLLDPRSIPSFNDYRGTLDDPEFEAQRSNVFRNELLLNDVAPSDLPDLTDAALFDRLFSIQIVNLEGDLGALPFRAGTNESASSCYCALWDQSPLVLEQQGLRRPYCGVCVTCGQPGHTRAHPSQPVTLAWCDQHYAELV